MSPISLAPAYEILDGVCLIDDEGDKRQLSDTNLFEAAGKAGKAGGKASKYGKSGKSAYNDECRAWAGKFRTCFHRSNSLDACDTISTGKPYIQSGEILLSGIMHLTLLQDGSSVTCQKEIQLEKAILTYLADNIGSESTFEPVCVYVEEYAKSKQSVPYSGGDYVDSTAIEINVHYVQKTTSRKLNALEYSEGRDLQSNRCTRTERALCCSQRAINSYIGEHCASKECNLNRCGSGRRPRKKLTRKLLNGGSSSSFVQQRASKAGKGSKTSLFDGKSSKASGKSHKSVKSSGYNAVFNSCPWYGMLNDDDFNEVVKKYTLFNPKMTRSLLGVEDTTAAAICSANRYSIDEMDTPSLSCRDFIAERCLENEDLPSNESIITQQPIEPTPSPVTPAPQPTLTDPPISTENPTMTGASGEPSISQVTALPTVKNSLPPASVVAPTAPPANNISLLPTLPPINSVFTPAPSSSTISVFPWTFESGVFPEIPWRTGGNGVWTVNTEQVDEGTYSIRSPDLESANITGPQVSNATLTLNNDFAGGLITARVLAR